MLIVSNWSLLKGDNFCFKKKSPPKTKSLIVIYIYIYIFRKFINSWKRHRLQIFAHSIGNPKSRAWIFCSTCRRCMISRVTNTSAHESKKCTRLKNHLMGSLHDWNWLQSLALNVNKWNIQIPS
jgi:hypothetical protein